MNVNEKEGDQKFSKDELDIILDDYKRFYKIVCLLFKDIFSQKNNIFSDTEEDPFDANFNEEEENESPVTKVN